jgi:hypothetical protein
MEESNGDDGDSGQSKECQELDLFLDLRLVSNLHAAATNKQELATAARVEVVVCRGCR